MTEPESERPWAEARSLAERDDFVDFPQETQKAIAEVEDFAEEPGRKTYKTADSLFAALDI